MNTKLAHRPITVGERGVVESVVGYCRVSTENQKEEGTIEIQRNALKEFCEQKNFRLIKIFEDDGVSGGLEDRPGLAEMFNFLEVQKGISQVLIFKLDRLARDQFIQEYLYRKLKKLDIELTSIKEININDDSGDPTRKAFRQFLGIMSELEKAFITMRMSAGRKNKIRNKGKYAGGGIAFGYQAKNKDLVIDRMNAKTVQEIFKMKVVENKSLREIARQLNIKQIPTARGGAWHAGTIKYILANPIYDGFMIYDGIQAKRTDLAIL